MTIQSALVRFCLIYGSALVFGGLVLNKLGVRTSGLNAIILIVCVMWICASFSERNARNLTARKSAGLIAGLWGVDVALQILIGFATLLARGRAGSDAAAYLLAVSLVGILHLLGIAITVLLVSRRHSKDS